VTFPNTLLDNLHVHRSEYKCLPCLVALCVTVLGCAQHEDPWAHFQAGGAYPSAAPTVAGDGSMLYLSSPASGHGDIYTFDMLTHSAKQLNGTEATETSPLLSDDGSVLAFERRQSGASAVVVFRVRDMDETILSPPDVIDEVSSMAPDGKQLCVYRSKVSSIGMGRPIRTVVLGVVGGMPREIPIGDLAAFAPDSKALVAVTFGDTGIGNVTLHTRFGEHVADLGQGEYADFVDGENVALVQQGEHGRQIAVVNHEGHVVRNIPLAEGDRVQHWLITRDSVLLVSKSGYSYQLVRCDYATGRREVIATLPQHLSAWRLYETQAFVVCQDAMSRSGAIWRVDYEKGTPEVILYVDGLDTPHTDDSQAVTSGF